MSITSKFAVSLATTLTALTLSLVLMGLRQLDVFFVADSLAFMVVALAFNRLDHKTKAALNYVGFFLFVGFVALVTLKIFEMTF